MIRPTLKRERELWAQDKISIGGIDEAGRGAWAGPVVAAVVVLTKQHKQHPEIADSKMLSWSRRAELYEFITDEALDFGIGIVSHQIIDEIGILNATKLAAKQAVEMLKSTPDYLLCDALDLSEQLKIEQEAIIKGDQKIYSISCASILAKVTRDNLMSSLASEYSCYEFAKHKGYGTKLHQENLRKYGVSNIHRVTYKPVRALLGE